MGLLKTITADGSRHHKFTLNVYYLESWIENNESYISWEFLMSPTGNYYWDYYGGNPCSYTITVNGQTWTGKIMKYDAAAGDTFIDEGLRIPVAHGVDGTKKLNFSFSVSSESASYLPGSANASSSAELPTIPRASTVSCSTANIENEATISIARKHSGFTHTLTYTFGSVKGTIATKTTSTSVKYTWPATFYKEIPNGKSGTGTITCITYNGNNTIGTTTAKFTANCKELLCAPTLAPKAYVAADSTTARLTGSTTTFIKGYTTATVETGGVARNSATMINQRISCGDKTVANVEGKGTLPKVNSSEFIFRAYDSRGFLTEQKLTRNLVNYVKPTCSIDAGRPTAGGTWGFTISGKCFNKSFGAVKNEIVVSYKIKENDNVYRDWNTANPSFNDSDDTYSISINLTGLNYLNNYSVQACIKDTLTNYVYSAEIKVKSTPIFDWGENDFNFNVPVFINGVEQDYIVDQDTKNGWFYRKWNSGLAECWQTLTTTAAQTKSLNGMYYSDSVRVDLPFTFTEVNYTTATGGSTGNMNIVRPFAFTTTYVSWCVVGMTSLASPTVRVNLEVKGRWK